MSVLSLENAYHSPEDNVEEVARRVFKITLEDDWLWEQDTEGAPGYVHSAPLAVHSSAAKEGSLLAPHEGVEETFGALLLIDHEMHVQVKNVTKLVDQLVVVGAQGEVQEEALEGEGKWLRDKLDKITHLNAGEDKANAVLLHELVGNMKNLLTAVRSIEETLAARSPEDLSQRENTSAVVDTEKKIHLTFCSANPTILLTLLITLILNVFRKFTRPWCNATLGLLNMLP
ncbi:hypothetical protein PAXRUDRAFT_767476 [Paxillus rubicundulus Ve08.2h10]|uniref:Uncharacterized protein n=1 Tax=Paxillus rubicundulus Ve08.2h10 TaxID=930991 RepID=A0A0D0DFS9_9AGAM|nr:hypothetical protein PAXRUDRAFT_767476 [Paxillus rubicundulus Ve08.2h10]